MGRSVDSLDIYDIQHHKVFWGSEEKNSPRERNELVAQHGHWEEHAGATWYDDEQCGKLRHTISAKTDWVVACGRNVETSGSDGTIINGVTTAWAPGGRGNCELGINRGHAEYSHWQ